MKSILDGTYLFLRDEKDKWIQEMDQTWTAVTFPKVEKMSPWQAYNIYLNSSCR